MLIAFAELRLVHNIAKRALLNQSKHAFCLTNQERNKANCDLASALFPAPKCHGACFPRLAFPRWASVACFPALGTGCMFLRRVQIGSLCYVRLLRLASETTLISVLRQT